MPTCRRQNDYAYQLSLNACSCPPDCFAQMLCNFEHIEAEADLLLRGVHAPVQAVPLAPVVYGEGMIHQEGKDQLQGGA